MTDILGTAVGQLLALATFFAFPALQYALLKRQSRTEGRPELWYLPDFGFRVVIRNLPRKRTLSGIEYRALLRRVVPRSTGSSVATYEDNILLSHSDFFLFPGNDQVILSFRLDALPDGHSIALVHTDKLGRTIETVPISEFDRVILDYVATLENYLNFDVRLATRAEIKSESLAKIWVSIQASDTERRFDLDRVRSVG